MNHLPYRAERDCAHSRVIERTEPWQPPCPYRFWLVIREFQCLDCGGEIDAFTRAEPIATQVGPTWPDVLEIFIEDESHYLDVVPPIPDAVCLHCESGGVFCFGRMAPVSCSGDA